MNKSTWDKILESNMLIVPHSSTLYTFINHKEVFPEFATFVMCIATMGLIANMNETKKNHFNFYLSISMLVYVLVTTLYNI